MRMHQLQHEDEHLAVNPNGNRDVIRVRLECSDVASCG